MYLRVASEVTLLEIPPCQIPMCGVAYSCSYVLLMIPNNLMSLFALYKAEAEDREARLTRIIRSLTKKVESLECDLSTFREEAIKNEERLMKKVSDLSAKLGSASSDLSARIASLPTLSVRAQARFRRQIGVLQSSVAVYIASNGGNDEEDC